MDGYTITSLADVPDVLGDYPGEMRMATVLDRCRAGRAHVAADARSDRWQRSRMGIATRPRKSSTS